MTYIGRSAFSGCSGLTSINIPDSVTYIGVRVFEGCSSLTSINIPDSVTYIGIYAFSGCASLDSLVIPASVTTIGDRAFLDCNLKSVYVLAEVPPTIKKNGSYMSGYYSYEDYEEVTSEDESDDDDEENEDDEDDDIVIIDGVKKRKVIKPTVLYVLPGMADAYKQLGKKGWKAFCDIREMSEEMYNKLVGNGITTDIAVADTESDIRITVNDGRITVTGVKPDTIVRVYDTIGRLVTSYSANDGSDIRLDAKGVYVVKAGNVVRKIYY